ncbi:MAG: hypothetical protein IT266_09750 [Saprospiraceae bacterium]|nr:hypothetical protein [Saprospiraceae bacterium]
MAQNTLNGVYRLQNAREMEAAFEFSGDGKFQFYFVYGAADRFANGTYSMEGNTLKLNSNKKPGTDFTVIRESKSGKGYTVVLSAPQANLVAGVVTGICLVGQEKIMQESDSKGIIHFDAPACDKIYLQHQIFPDVLTLIKDLGNDNNYFEAGLNEVCMQVSFMGIDFTLNEDTLTCLPNYFLPMPDIRFVRED